MFKEGNHVSNLAAYCFIMYWVEKGLTYCILYSRFPTITAMYSSPMIVVYYNPLRLNLFDLSQKNKKQKTKKKNGHLLKVLVVTGLYVIFSGSPSTKYVTRGLDKVRVWKVRLVWDPDPRVFCVELLTTLTVHKMVL